MPKKITEWIVDVAKILLACALTFAISMTMFGKQTRYQELEGMKQDIAELQQTQLTKQDLQEMNCSLIDKINARFDKFELYLQGKYKITPKK